MSAVASRGLGDVLLREKLISKEQLNTTLALANSKNISLLEALLSSGEVDEQSLIKFFSKQYRLAIMDLSSFVPDEELIQVLPRQLIHKYSMLPVGKRGDTLVIATSDPTNIRAMDDVRFHVRLRVEQVLALPSVLKSIIEGHLALKDGDINRLAETIQIDQSDEKAEENSGMSAAEDDAPIIQFVQAVLTDAIRKKASDIHVEPYEGEMRVRFRIDGDLIESLKPPPNVKAALTARLKVMAKMRLDEKRLPQDGRIRLKVGNRDVDFRVNTLPTVFGEKVVLRILDKSNAVVPMEKVGFEPDDLKKFIKGINEPWGICLVTGATGSGKTTTLYAALNLLNKPDVNISTIEDPVEYNFRGINQVQTKEHIGLTFAESLRALLRQDPDIVLLGEIRDTETAQIAFKAAMTGHLVLSTLHTNDAPSSVMRLKDMGVDVFMINSALHVIVAQKLLRGICKDCKIPDERQTPETLLALGFPQSTIGKFTPMRGKGCAVCRNTGTKGRVAVHEVLVLSETLKDKIAKGASTEELRKAAIGEGMKTQRVNCMRKIIAGICAVDELQWVGSQS
jgi:type IV pilus assembly protein PilB